jgi:hypothetical protein
MKPKPNILIKTECNDIENEEGEKQLYKCFMKKIFQSAHFRWVGLVQGNKAIFFILALEYFFKSRRRRIYGRNPLEFF